MRVVTYNSPRVVTPRRKALRYKCDKQERTWSKVLTFLWISSMFPSRDTVKILPWSSIGERVTQSTQNRSSKLKCRSVYRVLDSKLVFDYISDELINWLHVCYLIVAREWLSRKHSVINNSHTFAVLQINALQDDSSKDRYKVFVTRFIKGRYASFSMKTRKQPNSRKLAATFLDVL